MFAAPGTTISVRSGNRDYPTRSNRAPSLDSFCVDKERAMTMKKKILHSHQRRHFNDARYFQDQRLAANACLPSVLQRKPIRHFSAANDLQSKPHSGEADVTSTPLPKCSDDGSDASRSDREPTPSHDAAVLQRPLLYEVVADQLVHRGQYIVDRTMEMQSQELLRRMLTSKWFS